LNTTITFNSSDWQRAFTHCFPSNGVSMTNMGDLRGLIVIDVVEREEKRGKFIATLEDGEVLLESTDQPLLDCARVLLERGISPDTRVHMRNGGAPSLTATVGKAAKLTVKETKVGPRFVSWAPFPSGGSPTKGELNKRTSESTGLQIPPAEEIPIPPSIDTLTALSSRVVLGWDTL
jgi:hypothetical protein